MLPRIDLKKGLEALQAQAQKAQAQVAQAQKGPGSQTQIALGQILKKGQAQKACYRETDVRPWRPWRLRLRWLRLRWLRLKKALGVRLKLPWVKF